MKICVLIPVYMTDNSRDINLANLRKLKDSEFKYVDEVVICDQCFIDSDYIEGFTYLGPFGKLPNGVYDARNKLLEWFYHSDYDYTLLMDARESLSKAGLNSFVTICNAIHDNNINLDCIQGTIGINISQERIADKQRKDYKENVWIRPGKPQTHLHHTFISNFNKKYGEEIYIETDVIMAGDFKIPEDIYFTNKLDRYFDLWIVGEMAVNTGPQSASSWATTKGAESTKGIQWQKALGIALDKYCDVVFGYKERPVQPIVLTRVPEYKEELTDYKPRTKR